MKNALTLITTIVISQSAGLVGAVFTSPAIPGWYAGINKPTLNPPSWIFGPVWITLYTLMGISAFLIWKKGWEKKMVRKALYVFGLQLILNASWSIVFFGLQSPAGAFAIIVALWLSILWTMILFHNISKPAMWLLVPYILWVSFAGYLNFSIWMLN